MKILVATGLYVTIDPRFKLVAGDLVRTAEHRHGVSVAVDEIDEQSTVAGQCAARLCARPSLWRYLDHHVADAALLKRQSHAFEHFYFVTLGVDLDDGKVLRAK